MKRTVQIVLILLCSQILIAQEWAPIGARWYYQQFGFSGGLEAYSIFESVSDTVVLNEKARVIKYSFRINDQILNGGDIIMFEKQGRVYKYNSNEEEYELLYDFNAVEGDTIELGLDTTNYKGQGQSLSVVIDEVREEIIDGNRVQVQEVRSIESGRYFMIGPVYKNIGNEYFLFLQNLHVDPISGGRLNCYESPNLNIRRTIPCDYLSSTENEEKDKIRIYPNPTRCQISIELENEADEIEIVGVLGTKKKVTKTKDIELGPPGNISSNYKSRWK